MTAWISDVVAVMMGYLIGSISPAYHLTKWLKGEDIREIGSRHAGTMNVLRQVGLVPAAVTAVYDVLKGVVTMAIARGVLHTSEFWAYLAGLAAIAGHVFPAYLGFRGGRGAATATGILLFNLRKMVLSSMAAGALNLPSIAQDVGLVLFVILMVLLVSRREDFLSLTVLPLLFYLLGLRFPASPELWSTRIILTYIFFISLDNVVKFRLFMIDWRRHPDFKLWRTLARPLAMAFPLLSLYVPKKTVVALIGSVFAVFLIVDVLRLTRVGIGALVLRDIRTMPAIYKEKEEARISSMTFFLLGCLLSFLLFDRDIAVTTLTFLIFGDLAAKVVGLAYGRHRLFDKTVEGSLAHLTACVVAAYILSLELGTPLSVALAGAAAATAAEALPLGADDNVTVPVIAGAAMTITRHFLQ